MKSENHLCLFGALLLSMALVSCDPYFKNDLKDNSPTSGELKVYYDESVQKHVSNQAYTFQAIYPRAKLSLFPSSDALAVQALFNDSCEAIMIGRLLNKKEKKAFASRNYDPKFSLVAKSGLAVLCNSKLAINRLSYKQVLGLLQDSAIITDSLGQQIHISPVIDRSGSSLNDYLVDSLLKGNKLPAYFTTLNSSIGAINYVATHPGALAFINFAWFSDVDDSIVKANKDKIRVLALGTRFDTLRYEKPNQSSFKLNTYPFTHNIYVIRKTGDFTLAKGFESFVSGPKGQLVFLKQGLLPGRQGERSVSVNLEKAHEKD